MRVQFIFISLQFKGSEFKISVVNDFVQIGVCFSFSSRKHIRLDTREMKEKKKRKKESQTQKKREIRFLRNYRRTELNRIQNQRIRRRKMFPRTRFRVVSKMRG